MKKIILLFGLLCIVGCAAIPSHKSFYTDPVRLGEKFVFTSGCCGFIKQDTVEIVDYEGECFKVKHNDGQQHLHNAAYFRRHIIKL